MALFQSIRSQVDRIYAPDLIAELRKLLGKKRVRHFNLAYDPGQSLSHRAATLLETTEEALISTLAQRLDLPVVEEIPPTACHHAGKIDFALLIQCGATLVTEVTGEPVLIVSLDSTNLAALASLNIVHFAVSTPRAISASLAQGEAMCRLGHFDAIPVTTLLTKLSAEAQRFGQHGLLISPATLSYTIFLHDGGRAKGRLHARSAAILETLIGKALTERGPILPPIAPVPIWVKAVAEGEGFFLTFDFDLATRLGNVPLPTCLTFPDSPENKKLEQPKSVLTFESTESTSIRADVVLIEDDSTFARVLTRFLSRYSLQTIRFNSGEAAWEYLNSSHPRPKAIVCDMHLPGMTGSDFVRRVKRSIADKVPIIALTSDDSYTTEFSFLGGGASKVFQKSVDPRLLMQILLPLVGSYDTIR